jgi:CRISPR-associated Csx10 family RAMP protein
LEGVILKYEVELKLKTPLMIGGKKSSNNYKKSLNYFSGGVFYAALAREISLRCRLNRSKDVKEGQKKYWVQYKDNVECKENCELRYLCENFEKIKVGHFYPFGLNPYPMTAKKCKQNENHVCDMLLDYIDNRYDNFVDCQKDDGKCLERLESLKGFNVNDIRDNEFSYKLRCDYKHITRTSIDEYRKASKSGNLFAQDLLSGINLVKINNNDSKKSEIVKKNDFESYIDVSGDNEVTQKILKELSSLDELSIGGMITVGYGRFSMNISENLIEEESIEDLKNKIIEFNNRFKGLKDKMYIPIQLLTDSYIFSKNLLEFKKDNDNTPGNMDTEDYIKIIEKSFLNNLNEYLKLEKLYAEYDLIKGFNTSKEVDFERKPSIVMKAGSVLLFVTERLDENLLNKLKELENKGVGGNNCFGFGNIAICNRFHISNAR